MLFEIDLFLYLGIILLFSEDMIEILFEMFLLFIHFCMVIMDLFYKLQTYKHNILRFNINSLS